MSLGGNLNILKYKSSSVFDQIVNRNFNYHLELTLSQNQRLYQQYPYYLKMLTDDTVEEYDETVMSTPHFKSTSTSKNTRNSNSNVKNLSAGDKFGFIQQSEMSNSNQSLS